MQNFPAVVAAIISAALVLDQTALAQDASQLAAQNAQQANQQAAANAQQASQQATAAAQQASQAATQAAQPNTIPPYGGVAYARQAPPPATPASAVPPEIAAAHKVFLTNAGADANFPVTDLKTYDDVRNALNQWGHFELVRSPAEADLIFSLHDIAPLTNVGGAGYGGAYAVASPAFQLTILNAHTNTALWTISSPVEVAGSRHTRAQWFALSVTNLVSRLKVLANVPLSARETADLTTYPHSHTLRTVLLLTGGAAAATAIITAVALGHMKSSQDAFCNAHNIPLSMCAGG